MFPGPGAVRTLQPSCRPDLLGWRLRSGSAADASGWQRSTDERHSGHVHDVAEPDEVEGSARPPFTWSRPTSAPGHGDVKPCQRVHGVEIGRHQPPGPRTGPRRAPPTVLPGRTRCHHVASSRARRSTSAAVSPVGHPSPTEGTRAGAKLVTAAEDVSSARKSRCPARGGPGGMSQAEPPSRLYTVTGTSRELP